MPALTSVARVKAALRIPAGVTLHDAAISDTIDDAEADLLEQVGLTAWDAATVYVETHTPRPGSRVLVLRRIAGIAVAAVTVGGSAFTAFDEDVRGGVIRRVDGWGWDGTQGEVEVAYTAGLVVAGATPAALVRAATLHAARQYHVEERAGQSELDVQPIRTRMATFDDDLARREVDRYLARFRRAAG